MASLGLISCVRSKLTYPAPARTLYVSPLFKKAHKYMEQFCDQWYILSAKHGLVDPNQILSPYEETLHTKSCIDRKLWSNAVWDQLRSHLNPGDKVVFIAGAKYREFLVPMINAYGCSVEVPMEGMSIGRQLQWLSRKLDEPRQHRALDRLYTSLNALDNKLGGKRKMSECSGRQFWPKSGLYFFFEPGEYRFNCTDQRVVRVGTHGISTGSKATLWNRLRTHRGSVDGLGNHRGSIFRLHVGSALASRHPNLSVPSWGIGQTANAETRDHEQLLERMVSKYIGTMSILWLGVADEAGPTSDRAYLERNLIGLLASVASPVDIPSINWLGLSSQHSAIRTSGLWNVGFQDYPYNSAFLDVFDEYVSINISGNSFPSRPLAPCDWHLRDRRSGQRRQLFSLHED